MNRAIRVELYLYDKVKVPVLGSSYADSEREYFVMGECNNSRGIEITLTRSRTVWIDSHDLGSSFGIGIVEVGKKPLTRCYALRCAVKGGTRWRRTTTHYTHIHGNNSLRTMPSANKLKLILAIPAAIAIKGKNGCTVG